MILKNHANIITHCMSAYRRMWIYLLLLIISLSSVHAAKAISIGATTDTSARTTAGPGPGTNTREDDDDFDYEEISVTFVVKDMGGIELPALIHNDTVYLPVSTLDRKSVV